MVPNLAKPKAALFGWIRERTSPYQFYQFWLNTTDVDAKTYIRIFTLFDREVIEALEAEHDAAPHTSVLQKALAKDITIRVHGEAEYEKAIKSSEFLFGNIGIEFLNELNDAEVIGLFEGVPNFTIALTEFTAGINAYRSFSCKYSSISHQKAKPKK
jgi:tyrosyl-tRNA synthetase